MINVMCLQQAYKRRQIIEVKWIDGEANPADAMTKGKPCTALSLLIDTNRIELQAVGQVERTDLAQVQCYRTRTGGGAIAYHATEELVVAYMLQIAYSMQSSSFQSCSSVGSHSSHVPYACELCEAHLYAADTAAENRQASINQQRIRIATQ